MKTVLRHVGKANRKRRDTSCQVARLSILRIGQKAEYIREFVRIVNTYFVSKDAPAALP